MNNPFEEIFKRLENIEKMIAPVMRHNRVFGQLPVPLSQQGDDTVCQA